MKPRFHVWHTLGVALVIAALLAMVVSWERRVDKLWVSAIDRGPSSGAFRPVAMSAGSLSTVSAGSPSGTLSSSTPTLTVPITLARSDGSQTIFAYSITLHLMNLALAGPGTSGVSEGGFLASGGGITLFEVVDNGGGSYEVDAVTLGSPCGTHATNGTLFNLTVGSSAAGGTGSIVIDQVTLRDCANATSPSAIGTTSSVAIDNTDPAVTVSAPNRGEQLIENSAQSVHWSASDASGVTSVDLAYSTDGGATYPHVIATGAANSGAYAWTVPIDPTTKARVRVTAHDANGNSASDASDANFTIAGPPTGVGPSPDGSGPHVLSLAGCSSPAKAGHLVLTFSLASAEAATVDLIDLSGRRVLSTQVGSLGPGEHVVPLDRGVRLPTGVYMVRLTQGGRAVGAKVMVVN